MSIGQKIKILLQAGLLMFAATASLHAQDAVSLVGSGSNLAGSLYSAWTTQFVKQHSNVKVTYLPLGTAQSLKEISEGAGDFGGGEIPLSNSQKQAGKYTLTQFPTVLVAIAPIYKLPGAPELKFSGELLAEIFLGNIKNWKDARIAKLNPDAALPDLPITVVHLSGVKGSNYILTDFLSRTSAEWKSRVGKSASPTWPTGVETGRSQGMVTKVSATPGAIGYVELTYTKQSQIGYGSVENAAGHFVKPTATAVTEACTSSEESMHDDLGISLVNAPGKDSYPMASFTYIYVPTGGLPAARSAALKEFLTWALGDGQEIAGRLGYTVLPSAVASKSLRVVSSLK